MFRAPSSSDAYLRGLALCAGAAAAALALAAAARHFLLRDAASPPCAAPPPSGAALGGLASLVGNTALLELRSLSGAGYRVLAKAELSNPCGSSKDRVALALVREAEACGALQPGGVLVEGSSGSTGLSLALLARALGYRCEIFVPDDVSADKLALLRAAGATVSAVPAVGAAAAGHYVSAARARAAALRAAGDSALFVDQFEAAGNARAHVAGTGAELWAQAAAAGARVDAFVCGAGTGGTLAGVGACLRARWAEERARACRGGGGGGGAAALAEKLFLVDPPGSALLHAVRHGVAWAPEQSESAAARVRADSVVEGVGCDRVTANFARALALPLDGALRCADAEAVAMARYLLAHEGLFVGSSTALNCVGAVKAGRALAAAAAAAAAAEAAGGQPPPPPPRDFVIATLLCDGGARHLARFWSDAALAARGLADAAAARHGRGDLSFVRAGDE